MSTASALITAEQFSTMTFELPVELVRGEVVEMPRPDLRHGLVCGNVGFPLISWSRATNGGFVVTNDSGVVTERDPDTVRGPDVMFIPLARVAGGVLPSGFSDLLPSLAVEVMSPSDRWKQILKKIGEYLDRGVSEVWVVDPKRRVVHVYRPDDEPLIVGESETLESPAVLPGFSCEVREFFRGL